ncbi:ABC transporter ATP-binding protein [Methanocella sp. CWC-04]|uniref:ABC transporter ATP-binding protein n=1 Tax=Methanooceanicella nereidis TaxID=2052831 RepID=A0AAP2W513_9EURY|nr:ABC transporter ATP-binding protein [Methanocella sp. CWC-04]MCD1294990.1 ABC transporter ATP-binding protein [Methanocella sp. CWC-04]
MIRTEELTKVYDGVKAVDSLNLTVEKGEVFGFLGPNGAGKTTAIGMMVGLLEPTGGKCFVNGIDVTKNPLEVKKITGYLPDGVGFYPNLTAVQNLKYFSRFYGMKDSEAETRIKGLLEYVGLGNVDKPVGSYSRGMKQRLGLAQALLNDPDVLFLDEPTNGLDPQGVIQFRKIIKEQAEKGKTVFFSSHILDEVQHVCSTIGIISKGVLVARGTTDEVRKKMSKDETVTIIVKVKGDMPRMSDPRIINAVYNNGSAVIQASDDIRDAISEELFSKNMRVRELRLEEKSLEEIFLETVYRSE